MKTILAAAALAATVVMGSAAPSMAMSTDLGTLVDGSNAKFGNTSLQGNFSDVYTFTLNSTGFSSYDVSITASLANSFKVTVSNYTLTLTGGFPTMTYTDSKSVPVGTGGTNFLEETLLPGTYAIVVSGSSSGTGTKYANYGGAVQVNGLTPVPLPNSVAMLGAAVLGLGAFGAMRKRASASSAA